MTVLTGEAAAAPHAMSPGGADVPLLSVAGLAGERGERRLFERLDLCVHRGEVLWLRGRNGRGKTTLLRMLAGLTPAAEGSIHIAGRTALRRDPAWRADLVVVGHANALKDDLTAAEALRFLARLHGREADDAAIDAALTRLGVRSRRDLAVRQLSQGQRRRVALARLALPSPPALWLLDEPFDALDDRGIAVLNELLAAHVHGGGAVLLTSHQALSLQAPRLRELRLDEFAPHREAR
jgi:heme exporter protein A